MTDSKTTGAVTPDQIIEIALRRRWFLIIPFCIAMIAGIFLALFLPKSYEATTLILVEVQRVPTDYVRSIVSSDVDSRINTISQQIMSRTNLEKVINRLNLFSGEPNKGMLMTDKVALMRRNIDIQVTGGRGRSNEPDSFSITYTGKEPEDVMNVVNTLASHFIDENLKVREAQATGTSNFLEGELFSMRKKLEEVEESMKIYRKKYMGELPEQLESNLRILDRLQEQLLDRQTRLSDAKNRLAAFKSSVNSPAQTPSSTLTEETTDINQLNDQLNALMAKYTDRHPDVIRLKRTIANLKAEQEQEQEKGKDKGKGIHRKMSPPQQQALFEIQQEVKMLEKELADLQSQISLYKNRVENTPKREQELMGLQRDYTNIQESYSSLLRRKLEAEIAVNMEKKQQGERFRILDYARLPEKPSSPDMRRLFLLVTAAGLGIGCGIIFLLEYTDSSFRRSADIESFLELPVIAEIPSLQYPSDLIKKRIHLVITVVFLFISGSLLVGFFSVTLIGIEKIKHLIHM